jgi:membrane protease YdiL (CAAX protease family)
LIRENRTEPRPSSRPPPDPGEWPPPPDRPPAGIWSTWGRGRLLAWVLLLLIGDFAIQAMVYQFTDDLFLPVAAGAALAILLPCHLAARAAGGSLASEFHLGKVRPGKAIWAAVAAGAALLPTSMLADLSARIHPIPDSWIDFTLEHLPRSSGAALGAAVSVVLIAPLAEELLFRGIIHRLARRMWGPTAATLLSSLIFGLAHGEPWYLFGLIALGILLAYIYEMTRSVTLCFVTHAAHNGISFALLMREQDITATIAGGELGDVALLAGSLLLLGLACVQLASNDGR